MKDNFYDNQFSTDMFLHLVVEVFRCLHQQMDDFFHQCANMVWGVKDTEGVPLSILCAFYKTKGVNGVITCANNLYFEMYCYSR
jgi:hypothetical protein